MNTKNSKRLVRSSKMSNLVVYKIIKAGETKKFTKTEIANHNNCCRTSVSRVLSRYSADKTKYKKLVDYYSKKNIENVLPKQQEENRRVNLANSHINRHFIKWAQDSKLSNSEIGRRTSTDQSYISRLLRGGSIPSVTQAFDISYKLNIPLHQLWNLDYLNGHASVPNTSYWMRKVKEETQKYYEVQREAHKERLECLYGLQKEIGICFDPIRFLDE